VLQSVSTDSAPKALGPYSQAIRAGQFLFVSGQVPIDPATGQLVEGSIADQTRRAFENIGAILKAGGASFQQVVRTTVYLADLGDFAVAHGDIAGFHDTLGQNHGALQNKIEIGHVRSLRSSLLQMAIVSR